VPCPPGDPDRDASAKTGHHERRDRGFIGCPDCDGLGKRPVAEVDCTECGGTGEVEAVVCPTCAGLGVSAVVARPGEYLLLIDLPTGPVSFRCASRCQGPRYRGTCDEAPGTGAARILAAIEEVQALLTGKTHSPLALMAWASAA
jgi:RecJ-like exonuclease